MIDKYIYAVVRRLPQKQREDIEKELRSLIEDMLRERCGTNPAQSADIESALNELGDPVKLAGKYRDDKNYLIGPEHFDNYIFILKIVLIAVAFGTGLGTTIDLLKNPPVLILSGFAQVLASVISGVFQGFAWVTIIFAAVERYADRSSSFHIKKEWSLHDLPEIPRKEELVKPAEAVVGIVFSLLFLFLFVFADQFFGVYHTAGGKLIAIIPVFSQQGIRAQIPLFIALCVLSVMKECLRLILGKRNLRMGIVTLAINILSILLCGAIFTNPSVWNANFVSELNAAGVVPAGMEIHQIWNRVTSGFFYLIAFALLLDGITAIAKALRYSGGSLR